MDRDGSLVMSTYFAGESDTSSEIDCFGLRIDTCIGQVYY